MHYLFAIPLIRFTLTLAFLATPMQGVMMSEAEQQKKLQHILSTNEPTVFLTDVVTGITSFDPMDAMQIVNMRPMLSLYARAVEFSETGKYVSSILKSFAYDALSSSINFDLKRGLFFADGSEITVDDLAFMVARVALRMHKSMPYQYIAGIDEWLKRSEPLKTLPSGLKIDKDNNRVIIKFTRSIHNPFYRFTMALNGIIPKKCVDPATNRLLCEVPPFSGDYALSYNRYPFYELSIRPIAAEKNAPKTIRLVAIKMSKLFSSLHLIKAQHVIVSSSPYMQPHEEQKLKLLFRAVSSTETGSLGILMNVDSVTFEDERVRQFFAAEFRKTIAEQGYSASGSIFPTIYPGFMPLSALEAALRPFSDVQKKAYIKLLKAHPPVMLDCEQYSSFFTRHLELTLERLGIPKLVKPCPSPDKKGPSWLELGASISTGHFLLECLNPPNALKMLLIQGGYAHYNQLYGDLELLKLLDTISYDQNAQPNLLSLHAVGNHLFQKAKFAVVLNFGQEQFVRKDSPLNFRGQFLRQDLARFFTK